jgi:hypothetical protein
MEWTHQNHKKNPCAPFGAQGFFMVRRKANKNSTFKIERNVELSSVLHLQDQCISVDPQAIQYICGLLPNSHQGLLQLHHTK